MYRWLDSSSVGTHAQIAAASMKARANLTCNTKSGSDAIGSRDFFRAAGVMGAIYVERTKAIGETV